MLTVSSVRSVQVSGADIPAPVGPHRVVLHHSHRTANPRVPRLMGTQNLPRAKGAVRAGEDSLIGGLAWAHGQVSLLTCPRRGPWGAGMYLRKTQRRNTDG